MPRATIVHTEDVIFRSKLLKAIRKRHISSERASQTGCRRSRSIFPQIKAQLPQWNCCIHKMPKPTGHKRVQFSISGHKLTMVKALIRLLKMRSITLVATNMIAPMSSILTGDRDQRRIAALLASITGASTEFQVRIADLKVRRLTTFQRNRFAG